MDNKLLELQKRLKPIKKDSVNPHFKNSYFDINSVLEVVMPILNDLGLTLHQPMRAVDGKNLIETIISDGEKDLINSTILLPELTDPQKLGSCITYYRRYSLVSLLALEAEDDDANVASGHTQAKTYAPVDTSEMVKLKTNWIEDPIKRREQNDKIKAVGGKWNADEKSWYVPKNVTLNEND